MHNQRMRFPWEGKPFQLQAAFSTAQAVTPGQGQTVRVSGVRVGDITKVGLKDGHAVVTLALDPEYKDLVHTDATALLRPKTGLKDMFIELDPGTDKAPLAKRGWTLPVSNTLPDVNPDEILASLDSDTRDYLTLLVDGAGRGPEGARQRPARGLPALRAHAPRPGPRQPPGRPAPPEPQPARALPRRPQRRAGQQERRPRRAGRLVLRRLPLLRLRAGQRDPGGRRPARRAAPDDRHPRPRPAVRRDAAPGRRAPAAGAEGAQPRQRGRAALRQGGGADRPEPDPALRARRAAGGALDDQARRRAGRRHARPDELVHRAQPPLQPRRLQPERARGPEQGRARGGLPLLDRVAAAQRRLAVLDLRRQRPLPRGDPGWHLRRAQVDHEREPAAEPDAAARAPDPKICGTN